MVPAREVLALPFGWRTLRTAAMTAYLEYALAGNILELTHTEVPEQLRHMSLASS
jgi:hypothetical protein